MEHFFDNKLKNLLATATSIAIAMGCGVTVAAYQGEMQELYTIGFYGTDDMPGQFYMQLEEDVFNKTVSRDVSNMNSSGVLIEKGLGDNGKLVEFVLPAGGRLEYARDGYGNVDNSFVIYDGGNRLIGFTDIVTAYDGTGKAVDTTVTLNHNTLAIQVDEDVVNDDLTLAFSVYGLQTTSARANSFYDYFVSGNWDRIYNNDFGRDIDRLQLYKIYAFPTNSLAETAWDTVVNKFKNDSQWQNENGLKDQFICHNNFATAKDPWNLEPERPDVGYAATVLAACNPKP